MLGGGKQKVLETKDNMLKIFYQSQQEAKQYWTRYQPGIYAYEAKLFLRIKNTKWEADVSLEEDIQGYFNCFGNVLVPRICSDFKVVLLTLWLKAF